MTFGKPFYLRELSWFHLGSAKFWRWELENFSTPRDCRPNPDDGCFHSVWAPVKSLMHYIYVYSLGLVALTELINLICARRFHLASLDDIFTQTAQVIGRVPGINLIKL